MLQNESRKKSVTKLQLAKIHKWQNRTAKTQVAKTQVTKSVRPEISEIPIFCSTFRNFCVMSEIPPLLFELHAPDVSETEHTTVQISDIYDSLIRIALLHV